MSQGSSNSGRIGMARQKARLVEGGGFDRGFNKGSKVNSKRSVDQHKDARQKANSKPRDEDYGY
mgnify:CR=1 FL=1